MPENTIPQNLVIFSDAGPYVLRNHAGVTIATQSSPTVSPPSTTSLVDNPTDILIEESVGPQRYA